MKIRTKRIIFNLVLICFLAYFIVDSENLFREYNDLYLDQQTQNKADKIFLDVPEYKYEIDLNKSLGGILRDLFWNIINIFLILILILLVYIQEKIENAKR